MTTKRKHLYFLLSALGMLVLASSYGCGDITGKRYFKSLIINGVVISKYKEETGCFGAIVIKQNNIIDTIHDMYNCASGRETFWDSIQPGDSLHKESNTFKVTVIRNGKPSWYIIPTDYGL